MGTTFALGLAAVMLVPGLRSALWGVVTADPQMLRDAFLAVGPAAPLAAIALNVVQAVFAPVPGAAIVYLNGAVFGVWAGALLNLVGGVAGALVCFAIARTVLRPTLTRWLHRSGRIAGLRGLVESAGAGGGARRDGLTVLMLRLMPGAPFDLVSYGAGVSRVGWWPFLWGTAAGSAPHALAYALLGASLSIPLWMGLAAGAGFGLAVAGAHRLARRVRRLGGAFPAPSHVPALP